MTTQPPNHRGLCDECGQREPAVIDIGDGSRLCLACIAGYDHDFRTTWFRPLPDAERRQP